jgi:hypothetical protein
MRARRRTLLGDPNDITSEVVTDAQKTAWYNIIGQWESQAAQFDAAYADLLSQGDWVATQSADVQAQYADLVKRATSTYNTIQNIQTALADVKNALAGAWTAVTGAWSSVGQFFTSTAANAASPTQAGEASAWLQGWGGGLGFLPLVPIAVVAAALAAITYILADYGKWTSKVALLKQGITPPADSSGTTLTSSLGSLVMIAAVIGGLIFLPRLIGSYRSVLR